MDKRIVFYTVPLFTWSYFLYIWKTQRKKAADEVLYYKKNNCVITYAVDRNIRGWFESNTNSINRNTFKMNFTPLLYFINSAKQTLDIAVMTFNINTLTEALSQLKDKGVVIRMIVDSCETASKVQSAVSEIKYYNKIRKTENIFHNKYIIRDYGEPTCAVLNGSLNFTIQSIFNNYENVVITTNKQVAKELRNNFDEVWKYLPTCSVK